MTVCPAYILECFSALMIRSNIMILLCSFLMFGRHYQCLYLWQCDRYHDDIPETAFKSNNGRVPAARDLPRRRFVRWSPAERVVNKPISRHKITAHYWRGWRGFNNIMMQKHITSTTIFINYQFTSHIPREGWLMGGKKKSYETCSVNYKQLSCLR